MGKKTGKRKGIRIIHYLGRFNKRPDYTLQSILQIFKRFSVLWSRSVLIHRIKIHQDTATKKKKKDVKG